MGVVPPERAPPLPAIYQEPQAPQSYHMHDDPRDKSPAAVPTGVDYGYNIDNKVCFIYFPSSLVD
jgi:hypothetical protein